MNFFFFFFFFGVGEIESGGYGDIPRVGHEVYSGCAM